MEPRSFDYTLRVSYAECTVGNHVYYARYLDYLEAARGEFFRSLGRTFSEWQTAGFIFPVVSCQLNYKAPARYDDVLRVTVSIASIERIRLTFDYRIRHTDERLLVQGSTVHVCTDLNDKPARIPAELVGMLGP